MRRVLFELAKKAVKRYFTIVRRNRIRNFVSETLLTKMHIEKNFYSIIYVYIYIYPIILILSNQIMVLVQ